MAVECCSVSGCSRPRHARGYCSSCYQRWWKNNTAEKRLRAPAGTGHTSKKGYREIYVNGRKVREHRHVMSQILGRDLLPGETVHHKNGVRSDNRVCNLELRVSAHGPGITVADAVVWAREILERYG